MKKRVFIFSRSLVMVLLATASIYLINAKHYYAATGVSAGISWMWTLNVRDVSVSCWKDKLAYILGGVVGTATSLFGLRALIP